MAEWRESKIVGGVAIAVTVAALAGLLMRTSQRRKVVMSPEQRAQMERVTRQMQHANDAGGR